MKRFGTFILCTENTEVNSQEHPLRYIVNVNAEALVQTIRYIVIGMKKSASKLGSHVRVEKCSTKMISFASHDINLMDEFISGENTLSEINERVPLVNMARISFGMLFSVEIVCIRFYYVRLPVDNAKGGSKEWKMKLFSESSVGVH